MSRKWQFAFERPKKVFKHSLQIWTRRYPHPCVNNFRCGRLFLELSTPFWRRGLGDDRVQKILWAYRLNFFFYPFEHSTFIHVWLHHSWHDAPPRVRLFTLQKNPRTDIQLQNFLPHAVCKFFTPPTEYWKNVDEPVFLHMSAEFGLQIPPCTFGTLLVGILNTFLKTLYIRALSKRMQRSVSRSVKNTLPITKEEMCKNYWPSRLSFQ